MSYALAPAPADAVQPPIDTLLTGGERSRDRRMARRHQIVLDADSRRILEVLDRCGAQPALEPRGDAPAAPGATTTVIGREAGCRDLSKVPARLNQLRRLGLIQLSPTSLPDRRYAVLDSEWLGRTGADPSGARRCSIRLTRLGRAQLRLAA